MTWNPVISPGCYNMDRLNGSQLCIAKPGSPYTPPESTSLAALTPTTAAPQPTDIAQGTNTDCGRYYKVEAGEYCNLIVIKFGISLEDFTFLNPGINENCTNLYAEESYCVQAVGDINTYSGRPGSMTVASVAASSFTPFSDLPDATSTSETGVSTPTTLAEGTRADCNFYFNGSAFQGEASFYSSQCELAAVVYGVDLDSFGRWNQGLNVSSPSCSFNPGLQYCGKFYFGEQVSDNSPVMAYPLRNGTAPDCLDYTDAYVGRTCQDILETYSISIEQFYEYNPAVGSDCGNLWAEYSYCVRTPDTVYSFPTPSGSSPATKSATATTSSDAGPLPTAPTQTGQPTNCRKWHTAHSGDSCSSVADTYFITLEQFYRWNPAVSDDCSQGFWGGYAYCVGTTDTVSQTRSSDAPPSSTSSGVQAPTPTQANNAVSNCNKYSQAQSGDYCSVSKSLVQMCGDTANQPGSSSRSVTAFRSTICTRGTASWVMMGQAAATCSGQLTTTVSAYLYKPEASHDTLFAHSYCVFMSYVRPSTKLLQFAVNWDYHSSYFTTPSRPITCLQNSASFSPIRQSCGTVQ